MDELVRLGVELEDAAVTLREAARRLPADAPAAPAYGSDAPGLPGELGSALHARFAEALQARTREAVETAARLTDAATAVRTAASRYADVDRSTDRRLRREL